MKGNKIKTKAHIAAQEKEKQKTFIDRIAATQGRKAKFYVVEDIISHRYIDGEIEYRVKWKDFPTTESTYEPIEHLMLNNSLIKDYNHEHSIKLKKKITKNKSRGSYLCITKHENEYNAEFSEQKPDEANPKTVIPK